MKKLLKIYNINLLRKTINYININIKSNCQIKKISKYSNINRTLNLWDKKFKRLIMF